MPADDLQPPPELRAAVQTERERLEGLLAVLRSDQSRLSDELDSVSDKLNAVARRHRQLGYVLGHDEDGQAVLWQPDDRETLVRRAPDNQDDPMLRGAAIREAAVRAALGDQAPQRPRHYRAWLDLIETSGKRVDGRDPAATLLTQLSRCPLIIRAPEPGHYQLDREALGRLQSRRDALLAEASAMVSAAGPSGYETIDLAQALARVELEVRRADRAITEATGLIDALDARKFFPASPPRSAVFQTA